MTLFKMIKNIVNLILRYHTSIQRATTHRVFGCEILFSTFYDRPVFLVKHGGASGAGGVFWWSGLLCSFATEISNCIGRNILHRYGDNDYPKTDYYCVKPKFQSLIEMNSEYQHPDLIVVPVDKQARYRSMTPPEHYWHYYVPADLSALNNNG